MGEGLARHAIKTDGNGKLGLRTAMTH